MKPGKYGAVICGRVKVGKGSYILGGGEAERWRIWNVYSLSLMKKYLGEREKLNGSLQKLKKKKEKEKEKGG